jgi:predicted Zn-ribbon and HTH transcriptional regulator
LPIAFYESLFIESNSGLKMVFQLSRTGSSVNLQKAISGMVNAIVKRYDADDDEIFLKCPCNNCDVLIEFPARGVGQTVICPHCKLETVLFKPNA